MILFPPMIKGMPSPVTIYAVLTELIRCKKNVQINL